MSSERLLLHEPRERWWTSVLPILFAVLSTLPVLIIPYLPMADLPQHFAILSILCNINDPSYGFSNFYELDFTKSLYILPYLIGWGLSELMPMEMAFKCVVFLCLIAYPLGLLSFLRAQRKPAFLALLGIPFVYNLSAFGGFINFNLALGMAFFAFTLFSKERPTLASEIGLAILCLLLSLTHLYGPALIIGYAVLWGFFGDGKNTVRRYVPLTPCLIVVVFWAVMWQKAYGVSTTVDWVPVIYKITRLQNAVLGGYQDWSETWILCAFTAIVFLFAFYAFWADRKALTRYLRADRIFYIYIILNFFAYLVLPANVPTAKFIFIRHSIIAFCLLPLITPPDFLRKVPVIAIPLLVCLALASIGNTWVHLLRFDYEAYPFDHIIEKTPKGSKVIQITLDFQGKVMKTGPYIHFPAYVQGKKGGFIATSFAMYSWLAPIKKKDNVEIPIIPVGFEWSPSAYDYYEFGYYYNYVIIRGYHPVTEGIIKTLPYTLVYEDPPWRLYKSNQ